MAPSTVVVCAEKSIAVENDPDDCQHTMLHPICLRRSIPRRRHSLGFKAASRLVCCSLSRPCIVKRLINIGFEVMPTRSFTQIHHYLICDFGPVNRLQETGKSSKYISQQTSSGRFSIYLPCPGVEQIDARRTESERLEDWLQGLRIFRKTLHHIQKATLFERVHNNKVGISSALEANS